MLHPLRSAVLGVMLVASTAAPAGADALLGRVFLLDGTVLTCAGEYARVGDRIVFSMPIGTDPDGQPHLELLSLSAGRVDWDRTDRYRQSVRASQYAQASGESDFTLMTGEVARTLNDIAFTSDPARKLELAEAARRRLVSWPADHYGYRASEVREIVGLLDEAVSDLRASAGQQTFDLNLVAMAAPGEPPLLPPPTPRDVVAQALAAADLADVPAERTGLLSAVLAYLDGPASSTMSDTARLAARTFAERRLGDERRADREYGQLARTMTATSALAAKRADVRGIERLTASLAGRDGALGRRRPDVMRAIATVLSDDLAAARRLRLARDTWRLRVSSYRSYTHMIRSPLSSLQRMSAGLEDIKRLAGPETAVLEQLRALGERAARSLHLVVPPADLANVHALLESACEMGRSAARIRLEAVTSGQMHVAWNASAAAAGSLMLFSQARDELARYLAPPAAR